MALSPLSRRAGMLSVTAAVLIVLSQDLGPSRAGRTAAGYPRAPAGRPDRTARPRLAAGCRRLTCLRLGPSQIQFRTMRPPLSGAPSPLTGATRELIPATR
jgi:hypothetical protein